MKQQYRIGIFGGSGFIGSSLARYLSRSFRVKVFDIVPPKDLDSFGVEYHYCDIRRYDQVERALKDIDLVINTAIIQIPSINDQKKLGYEVNIIGTENICRAVDKSPTTKGLILAGSWHVIGERELNGVINEEFGFRPDKVEDRAKLYALSKIAQETIVRFYNEMSEKFFGVIRMGTVLGEGMPEKTAANIFITRGLRGETLTVFKHSRHRPMLYVDIDDVCMAYERFAFKILEGKIRKGKEGLSNIVNVYYPEPITVLELAEIVRDSIIELTEGKIRPSIEIVDHGEPELFSEDDKFRIKVDITKLKELLGIEKLLSPRDAIKKIIRKRLKDLNSDQF